MLRQHEVLKLLLEELLDNFVVRGRPTFHPKLESLNFSLCALQGIIELGAAGANVLTG